MQSAQTIRRARRLRRAANAPEERAWTALRTLRKHGFPVRRQHPLGQYVVDFAIVSERLVIEVDGGIHEMPDVAASDAQRQQHIEALGWRVIRVSADTAMSPHHLLALVQSQLGL